MIKIVCEKMNFLMKFLLFFFELIQKFNDIVNFDDRIGKITSKSISFCLDKNDSKFEKKFCVNKMRNSGNLAAFYFKMRMKFPFKFHMKFSLKLHNSCNEVALWPAFFIALFI